MSDKYIFKLPAALFVETDDEGTVTQVTVRIPEVEGVRVWDCPEVDEATIDLVIAKAYEKAWEFPNTGEFPDWFRWTT